MMMPLPEAPKLAIALMTTRETAERLRVSHDTVFRLVATRQLPAFKIAQAYRFRVEDVEAFLASHRVGDN
jgi:excisionase family DNA binding protein